MARLKEIEIIMMENGILDEVRAYIYKTFCEKYIDRREQLNYLAFLAVPYLTPLFL